MDSKNSISRGENLPQIKRYLNIQKNPFLATFPVFSVFIQSDLLISFDTRAHNRFKFSPFVHSHNFQIKQSK